MKINFKHYLLYMFTSVLIISMIYNLICIFFALEYIVGNIRLFEEEYLNITSPYVILKSVQSLPSLMLLVIDILPYFIIFICGFKMVHYVNLHTGYDQNMKRLLKQLAKTLIILVNESLWTIALYLQI
ncbi:unnamed protein product [Meloidogyne enterolobii]|uniref:Uncharacterized protein n=1 Tax=Meloidogyne enterolobii TaxID=390850 RepID=A0ACB1AW02_MELEN